MLSGQDDCFNMYDSLSQDTLSIWTAARGKRKINGFNNSKGNVLSLIQG